ncbi:hypothetical protein ACQKGD_27610 [Peribacillus frigoritolerans]|uniref:hypothetical protein n=1 Tax=Peribacillus frigoritolerans TaxID=450367 RepID=UPI003D08E0DF
MDKLTDLIADLIEKKMIALESSLNSDGQIDILNILHQLQKNSGISDADTKEVIGKINRIVGIDAEVSG